MQTSDQGAAIGVSHEALVTRAYRCPAGVLTIGIGHTSAAGAPKVVPGMIITEAEARRIYASDLRKFEARVTRRMGPLPQAVFDGSVLFDFNTGAITTATWVKRFLAGDVAGAERSFLTWNKGGGRVLKGLIRRRADEAAMIFRRRYPVVHEDAGASTNRREIANVQQGLKDLGFYTGDIDGIRGPLTRGAVENFQRKHDLVVDGIVGPATRATLIRALDARRANQVSNTAGGATGAGAAGADAVNNGAVDGAGNVDPAAVADVNLWIVIGAAIAAAALVWGAFWLWRNRGRMTGRRVPT